MKIIHKPVSSTGNSKSGQKGWTPIGRVWPIKEQESRKGAVSERVRKREFRNCCTVGFTLLGHTTTLGSWWSRRRIGNPPIVCVRVLPIWRSVYYHCVCCVGVLCECIVCVPQCIAPCICVWVYCLCACALESDHLTPAVRLV